MKFHLPILLTGALVLIGPTAFADEVDKYMSAQMSRHRVPGACIAVIKNGKVVRVQGYGFANIEHAVKVKPETMFQSGSLGKQFTAALVLKLVADGKIALDDPVHKYLPNANPAWEKITIRHLLTHTSGLADPYSELDMRRDYTEDELVEIDGNVKMLFEPGEDWSYSNMGYHVLGFICSKVGGKFYGDQLKERIFRPAGMNTARIISEANIIPNRAAGYELQGLELVNQSWVSPSLNTTADGSLYLSIRDLIAWDKAIADSTVLSSAEQNLSWTPVKLNDGSTRPYGFGWQLEPFNEHKLISHGGAWQGFRTSFLRFVDDKVSVIVLANSSDAEPESWAQSIASFYIAKLIPTPPPVLPEADPKLATMVDQFLAGSDVEAKAFLTPECFKEVGTEGLKDTFDELKKWGHRRKVSLIEKRISKTTGDRIRGYRIAYDTGNLILSFKVDSNDKIMSFGFQDEMCPLRKD